MPRMSNTTARHHAKQLYELATRNGVYHTKHGYIATVELPDASWQANIRDEFGLWMVHLRSNGAVSKATYVLLPRAQDYAAR